MIKDVERHLKSAVTAANRNFFNRFLAHDFRITRNLVKPIVMNEVQLVVNEWNQREENRQARLLESTGHEDEAGWYLYGPIEQACDDAVTATFLNAGFVNSKIQYPTAQQYNPVVKPINQHEVIITFSKGELDKQKRTLRGGRQSIVNQAVREMYQECRSKAFNNISYPARATGGMFDPHKKTGVPGRTSHKKQQDTAVIKGHGRAASKGGQIVSKGKIQTTVANVGMAKDWRKFVKGKIKGSKKYSDQIYRLMGVVRKEITDALATEYEIHRWTRDTTYGGIDDKTVMNLHATDHAGNVALQHFDADGIRAFIEKKAAAVHKDLVKKWGHLEPDLKTSPTKRQRAQKLANIVLIEAMLKIKLPPTADFRLKVNRNLLAKSKKVKKATRSSARGQISGQNKKKKATKKQGQVGGRVKAKTPRSVKSAGKTAQSPIALRNLLNEALPAKVAQNMGSPALVYRTGRFANSARVDMVHLGNRGGIGVDYTYMKYPYQTFEPGFAQGSTMRDPRKIIGESIRELATGILGRQPHTIRRT